MSEAYVWPELKARRREDLAEAPEQIRERAREEGYAAGFAQALEDGRRQAQAEVAAMREQLGAGLARLDRALTELSQRELSSLTEAALAVCGHVLGWELRTSPETFEELLAEALARLDAGIADVDVYLHPDDHGWLQSVYQGVARLHADDAVPVGGLSVRTLLQAADYDPQARLAGLFDGVRHDLTD